VARNGSVYSADGRYNVTAARFRRDFNPIDDDCDCYTCGQYTRAYLHHLFRAKERLAATLATIHNERFTIGLVDEIRGSIDRGEFWEFKAETLGRYYARRVIGAYENAAAQPVADERSAARPPFEENPAARPAVE
jgi:queuine tRNA-ribosyltransferase